MRVIGGSMSSSRGEGDASAAVSVEFFASDRGAIYGRDYRVRAGRLDFGPASGARSSLSTFSRPSVRTGVSRFRAHSSQSANRRARQSVDDDRDDHDDLTSGAILEVRESALDFGRIRIGQVARRTVSIRNSGRGTLSFEVDAFGGGEGFVLAERPARTRLGAGETTTFAIEFRPRWRVGRFTGTVVVRSNAGDRSIALRAESLGELPAVPSLLTTAVDFGAVRQGDRSTWPVTIRNTGFGRLRILDARIDSGSSSGFYVATRPNRVDPGLWETSTILVGFSPSGYGDGVVYGRLR
jgi:hypothetical protein